MIRRSEGGGESESAPYAGIHWLYHARAQLTQCSHTIRHIPAQSCRRLGHHLGMNEGKRTMGGCLEDGTGSKRGRPLEFHPSPPSP